MKICESFDDNGFFLSHGSSHANQICSSRLPAFCRKALVSFLPDSRRCGMAEPLYRQALQVKEANLGKDNSAVAMILKRLGVNQAKMGRYAEAEHLFQQAVEIQDTKPGRNHPDKAWSLNNLGWLYSMVGRFRKLPRFSQAH